MATFADILLDILAVPDDKQQRERKVIHKEWGAGVSALT